MPRQPNTLRPVRSLLALAILTVVLALSFATPAQAYSGEIPLGEEESLPAPVSAPASEAAPAIPSVRASIEEYVVQQGDTVYGIAARYGLSTETIIWANNMESDPDKLSLDQKLTIPPVNGVLHTVAAGDTLDGIAARYKADPEAIRKLVANGLTGNGVLQPGQRLTVPGGTPPPPPPPPPPPKPAPTPEPPPAPAPEAAPADPAPAPVENAAPAPDAAPAEAAPAPEQPAAPPAEAPAEATAATPGKFGWPIHGTFAQGFRKGHRAIDILGVNGEPAHASRGGVVTVAGWSNGGWGNYVVIDHGDGYRTLYAHLSRIDVAVGQQVNQGDQIGAVGDTGRATAYHVHLEIYQNGVQVDPLPLME